MSPPPPVSRPGRRLRLRASSALLALLAVAGCAEPTLPEDSDGEGAERPVEFDAPDLARDALLAQLGTLRETVAAVRDELGSAMEVTDAADGRQRGERAVSRLVDAPELDGDERIPTPALFPSTTTERGSIEGTDVLTATLTAARDAGGDLGRSTVDLLRDPLAGDLGAWQRDPAGVVAAVRDTADAADDLPTLERAVFELPGEGTRALAWALLTADAQDPAALAAYAERGVAHLDLVLDAIDTLLVDASAPDDGAERRDGESEEEDA